LNRLVTGKQHGYRHQITRWASPWTRSHRLRIVLTDWQNLRLSLASAGRRAGPVWVLRALVDEVRRVLPAGAGHATTMRLFFTPTAEHRPDRVLLESAFAGEPTVIVRLHCVDGDLIGLELALHAADAWHSQADEVVAVVTDAGRFARVVRHYEGRPGRRPPWLLHLHERPPAGRDGPAGLGGGRPPAATRRLRLRLDQPAGARAWNPWDGPAWALRRLAARTDEALVRRLLRPGPGERGRDPWREAELEVGVRLGQLERVDNLVADLWRLDWGAPFHRDRAEAEAARRLTLETADARAAVDALLVAELLRWHDTDRLEVPSSWREGLLLPTRRVLLRLACQRDLTYPLDKLVQQHRRRFIRPPDETPAVAPDHHRRVEHESRVESWRWVRHAALERLAAVEERPGWRSGGPTWTLTGSKLADGTVRTAQRIWSRLEIPVPASRLEAELEGQEGGVVRAGRWLRCLRDVGVVRRRGDYWERGGQKPHLS